MIGDPMGSPGPGRARSPHDTYGSACGRGCSQRLSRWSRHRSDRCPPEWPVRGYRFSKRSTQAARPNPTILPGPSARLVPGLVSVPCASRRAGGSSPGRGVSLVSCAPHRVGSGWVPVGFTDFKSAVPVASYREEGSTPLHSRQTSVSATATLIRNAPGGPSPPGANRVLLPFCRRMLRPRAERRAHQPRPANRRCGGRKPVARSSRRHNKDVPAWPLDACRWIGSPVCYYGQPCAAVPACECRA